MQIPREWTFKNIEVASEFDSHVREQLPWYELATSAVTHIARHYIPENGLIYDIGASTGNIATSLSECIDERNASLLAIDNSTSMIENYSGMGQVILADATKYTYKNFDVAILFLVLMFIPVSKRYELIETLINKMNPGGVIIIVDKTIPPDGYLSTVIHRLTIAGKVANGCDMSLVTQKELSLGGIQRPLDREFASRFRYELIEFFRFGEFVGWVIEAPF